MILPKLNKINGISAKSVKHNTFHGPIMHHKPETYAMITCLDWDTISAKLAAVCTMFELKSSR